MFDRRQFVASTAAILAAAFGLPAMAAASGQRQGNTLTQMLDEQVLRLLRNSPLYDDRRP